RGRRRYECGVVLAPAEFGEPDARVRSEQRQPDLVDQLVRLERGNECCAEEIARFERRCERRAKELTRLDEPAPVRARNPYPRTERNGEQAPLRCRVGVREATAERASDP